MLRQRLDVWRRQIIIAIVFSSACALPALYSLLPSANRPLLSGMPSIELLSLEWLRGTTCLFMHVACLLILLWGYAVGEGVGRHRLVITLFNLGNALLGTACFVYLTFFPAIHMSSLLAWYLETPLPPKEGSQSLRAGAQAIAQARDREVTAAETNPRSLPERMCSVVVLLLNVAGVIVALVGLFVIAPEVEEALRKEKLVQALFTARAPAGKPEGSSESRMREESPPRVDNPGLTARALGIKPDRPEHHHEYYRDIDIQSDDDYVAFERFLRENHEKRKMRHSRILEYLDDQMARGTKSGAPAVAAACKKNQ